MQSAHILRATICQKSSTARAPFISRAKILCSMRACTMAGLVGWLVIHCAANQHAISKPFPLPETKNLIDLNYTYVRIAMHSTYRFVLYFLHVLQLIKRYILVTLYKYIVHYSTPIFVVALLDVHTLLLLSFLLKIDSHCAA